jgi:hypothetical protein
MFLHNEQFRQTLKISEDAAVAGVRHKKKRGWPQGEGTCKSMHLITSILLNLLHWIIFTLVKFEGEDDPMLN